MPPMLGNRPDGHLGKGSGGRQKTGAAANGPPVRVLRIAKNLFSALYLVRLDKSVPRIRLAALAFLAIYGLIAARLIEFALRPEVPANLKRASSDTIAAARPDILDRNGEILATDVKVMSVFAEPRRIIDKDEAVELLTAVLPDVDANELRAKVSFGSSARSPRSSSKKSIIWACPALVFYRRTNAFIRTARLRRMCLVSQTSTASASRASKNTSTAKGLRICRAQALA